MVYLTTAACVLLPQAAWAAPALPGATMTWPWALPFIGILLSIATGPLLFAHIWHHHYGKIAFAWAALTLLPLALAFGAPASAGAFVHAALTEYLSFIVLLFSLYVVAGGILITGDLRGAADQYRHPRLRNGDCQHRRHHRRAMIDPAADPRQRYAAAQQPCRDLFHFPGRQYRRR